MSEQAIELDLGKRQQCYSLFPCLQRPLQILASPSTLLASPSTTRRLGDFAGDLAGSFAGDLAACCMRLLTGRQTVQSSSSCSSMVVLGSLTSNLRDLSSSSLTSIVYPSCSSSGSFGFSAVPLTMSGFASDCAVTHSCS